MLALIARTISTRKTSLLAYILIAVGMIWMLAAFFPAIKDQADNLAVMIESYPKSFLEAFGVEENLFLNFECFLAVENFSLMWPIILIVLVISLGSSAIAGEIDQGTIEILLAQPISRAKIYWAKYIAGLIIMSIFIFVSVFSVIPFAHLHKVDYDLQKLVTMFALGELFGWVIFSLTITFSSIFSTKGKPSSITAGILILMYAINLAAKLKESVENLKYFSFFHYYDFNAALIRNKIEPLTIGVFLGVSIICTIIGLVVFVKRDVAT